MYTVSYESSAFSGEIFIRADSQREALEKFKEDFLLYGDEPPSAWVSACWAQG